MSGQVARVIRFPVERRQATRLVPLTELIEKFGFSERWWRYRLKEGLPHRKWAGGIRFDPSEVQRWMEDKYGS